MDKEALTSRLQKCIMKCNHFMFYTYFLSTLILYLVSSTENTTILGSQFQQFQQPCLLPIVLVIEKQDLLSNVLCSLGWCILRPKMLCLACVVRKASTAASKHMTSEHIFLQTSTSGKGMTFPSQASIIQHIHCTSKQLQKVQICADN